MTISDLSYLTSEASSVMGGGIFELEVDQSNRAYVDQRADSRSYAEAFRGNASSEAESTNRSYIDQSNSNRS